MEGSGCPQFQHFGGISATARRSADTKFCDEQAAQWIIIGDILPFLCGGLTKKFAGS
jgi:hypothetical protein